MHIIIRCKLGNVDKFPDCLSNWSSFRHVFGTFERTCVLVSDRGML